ncbi:MAG: tripartite tricarboxylate transporter substrate binding protein [Bdellovibrionales bacterium]|nr:tripartite tricarboxylate transporter substrate binding protein [Ramlibacter sp.]
MAIRHLLLAAAALLMTADGATAQTSYPNRPVKIVVGYVPGGGPDFVARTLGQKLGEILGQPFVVDNRPGAGATTATAFVAKSAPDGYTLLLGETGQLVVAPYIYKNLAYDTARDFTPISMMASGPLILVANSKLPIRSMQDLFRIAKAQPGKIDVGTSGVGTIHHVALEVLKADAGLDLAHVPYKGSGQSVAAGLAGDVPMLVTSMTAAGAQVTAGKLNVVAVTSAGRIAGLPDTPAISEFVKDYDYSSEMGLLAPAGLPPEILARLSRAIKQAVESPDVLEAFRKSSTIIKFTTPEEYTENIRCNLRKYDRAVKIAKIPMAD